MRKKGITRKDVMVFSIFTFVVVFAWVGFSVYHKWVTSTITKDLQMQITPIDPNFDTDTIQQLKTRRAVIPLNTLQGVPTPSDIPPSPTVDASPSAILAP